MNYFTLTCHISLTAGSEKDEDGFYFKGNTSVPSYHKTEELQEPSESWDNGTLPNFFSSFNMGLLILFRIGFVVECLRWKESPSLF